MYVFDSPFWGVEKIYLYDFTDEQLKIIYDEFNLNLPDTITPQYLYYYDQGWTLMPIPGSDSVPFWIRLTFANDDLQLFLDAYDLKNGDPIAYENIITNQNGENIYLFYIENKVILEKRDSSGIATIIL